MRVAAHHTLEQLQVHARSEQRPHVALRIRLVIWALQKRNATEISQLSDLSLRRVQDWIRRYNREGLAGLANRPGRGRKPPLSAEEQARLKAGLDAGPTSEDGVCTLRGKDVQRILAEEFGKLRRLAAVYHLLHRLGYSCFAAAAASSGRSSSPRGFQKKFPQRIAEIRQQYSDREVQIFFQDETRFGQQGSLTRVWAPKGSRPRTVRQTQYQYVYVIAQPVPTPDRQKRSSLPTSTRPCSITFWNSFLKPCLPRSRPCSSGTERVTTAPSNCTCPTRLRLLLGDVRCLRLGGGPRSARPTGLCRRCQ